MAPNHTDPKRPPSTAAYQRGCRCDECRAAKRKSEYVQCPECGGNMYRKSSVCRPCSDKIKVGDRREWQQRFVATIVAVSPIRTIDSLRQSDSKWRPPHLPPTCENCNGLAWFNGQPCNQCKNHPGSTTTHSEWTRRRLAEVDA